MSETAEAEVCLRDSQVLVRERNFTLHPEIIHLVRELRRKLLLDKSYTGTLFIDLNQGGVGSIRFREEARIFPEGVKITP